MQQPCDVIGQIAATICLGAYCNDVPTIGQPSLVMAKTRTADVAVITTGHVADRFYSTWPVYRMQGGHLRHSWYLYVACLVTIPTRQISAMTDRSSSLG